MENEMKSEYLFQEESNALAELHEKISNSDISKEEILEKIENISKKVEKSFLFTKKLGNISDIQGKELKRTEIEIKAILDNSNQGFLTIDENFIVGNNYSRECRKIFGKKIAQCNIIDLFQGIEHRQLEDLRNKLKSVFTSKYVDNITSYIVSLPETLRLNDKYLLVKYKTFNINTKFYIMLIVTDVTKEILNKKQLEDMYYLDSLTGLNSQAYIEKVIPMIKNENKYPTGMIFGDMNGLKFTNDVFGHEKGDVLLKTVSNILKQSCWADEIIIRWAGDEFVIFVFNATVEILKMICNRVKVACQNCRWDPVGPDISLGYALQSANKFNFGELFKLSEKNMYNNKLHDSREFKRHIIMSINKLLEKNYFITEGHCERVKSMTVKLCQIANLLKTPSELKDIELAAKLHDMGKISISPEILKKTTPLTTNERDEIKAHSEVGYRMAQSINEPAVANILLYRHERWDGEGYPEGLKREQIPAFSRAIAIAESFDVMTNDQAYKEAISVERAIEEILNCSGTQFDPDLVRIFIDNKIYDTDLPSK